jgi:hypothetical protein
MDCISYGKVHLYQGVLILCQSYHGDYACPYSSVAMLDSDGMSSNTQVPAVRCVWVPLAVSTCVRH